MSTPYFAPKQPNSGFLCFTPKAGATLTSPLNLPSNKRLFREFICFVRFSPNFSFLASLDGACLAQGIIARSRGEDFIC
jgi:hypothetical protein